MTLSRPLRFKLIYVAIVAAMLGAMAALAALLPYNPGITFIVAGVVLFIPGRVMGLVFREHWRGRRLHDERKHDAALQHFTTFLDQIRNEPWRKRFMWLCCGFYTRDIEAMTLNNIGSCLMHLGRFEAAEEKLREALERDAEYAMPYWNLAALAFAREDDSAAEIHWKRAAQLGYRHAVSDHLIQALQALTARLDGLGASQPDRQA